MPSLFPRFSELSLPHCRLLDLRIVSASIPVDTLVAFLRRCPELEQVELSPELSTSRPVLEWAAHAPCLRHITAWSFDRGVADIALRSRRGVNLSPYAVSVRDGTIPERRAPSGHADAQHGKNMFASQ